MGVGGYWLIKLSSKATLWRFICLYSFLCIDRHPSWVVTGNRAGTWARDTTAISIFSTQRRHLTGQIYTMAVFVQGQRYCGQKKQSENSPDLPHIPEHQHTLTIKGQLPRSMVPQTQVLLGSERQDWSAAHRKLEAGIQQGTDPSRIPGYASKTGWPFSSWPVSLVPHFPSSVHLTADGRGRCRPGLPQRCYKPPSGPDSSSPASLLITMAPLLASPHCSTSAWTMHDVKVKYQGTQRCCVQCLYKHCSSCWTEGRGLWTQRKDWKEGELQGSSGHFKY